jgi:ribosomal protein S18 acetylase RimI-like enzyme
MVDRARQRQGIGQALSDARLGAIRLVVGVDRVAMETSQLSAGFYVRLGFSVTEVTKNGIGPGLDRWVMVMELGAT